MGHAGVPANAPGIVPTKGIVSGLWTQYYPEARRHVCESGHDRRAHAATTYNVLDNHSGAKELWLRGGFQWDITNNVTLKSQVYALDAKRHWFNNEINSYNDGPTPFIGAKARFIASVLPSTKTRGSTATSPT